MATLPTTPTAATVGSKVTASNWNDQVQLPEEFFRLNRPVCLVYATAAQSIPNTTNTAILFNTERLDRDNQHSTSANTDRVVIGNTLGWYRVTGSVSFVANATGIRTAFIWLNGAGVGTYAYTHATATGNTQTVTVTSIVQATASTDYVQLGCFQSSTASLNLNVTTSTSSLLVEWIGS